MLIVFTIGYLTIDAWKAICYAPTNEESTPIVDPDMGSRTFMRWLEGKEVTDVILAHCRSDHIGVVNELVEAYGCPVTRGVDDVDRIAGVRRSGFDEEGIDYTVDHTGRSLAEGDVTTWGGDTLQVLRTPGHTPGSICLPGTERRVSFSGDTLFSEAIGSAVFVPGDHAELMCSCARLS